MNRNQRGRVRKQKGSVLRTDESASRTEEMVVKPKETFLERAGVTILAESKFICFWFLPFNFLMEE